MMRMFVFASAFLVLDFATNGMLVNGIGLSSRNLLESKNLSNVCTDHDALMYSHEFHNCFVDRKYADGGKDLENIVDRILDHSADCIGSSSKSCRPDYRGFMIIMDKVIYQMKDYFYMYLELITHGRNKIKDLDCVETSLSNKTYGRCFNQVFGKETPLSEKEFQRNVEKAISCTNKSHTQCSRAAKTSLNRLVRTILRVQQPEEEDIVEEEKPSKPWRWYDYIIQPFVSLWKSITSFFGF